ncbi:MULTISPECIES: type II secretion system minor pseudopilin GspH [unclassified Agarivorans]|uniref:type II secretion system minor pseudopilin GspH n=1 Tax=unclassified Agarivorans TaxID=2636026 RepID=UPI0026E46B6E|nr:MULTISPECIES: type II secretion system minor pseudopilin GspH [unclassified Agarivorans]MDO6687532.1 type II secretion system minor pseudopilin GspH [Agarivorans sp. 3_MG-2023]MDO6717135.1 type II secretion system minor pseudopilin GspH [Agarivorans sp. 2_MG-2023]MDO6765742.1 type II secretion system minor pseudopilin GspH [Agarivorans sp. 1_MG-2023]
MLKSHLSLRSRQQGFTLLEVILVLLLMSIGIYSVVMSVSGSSEQKIVEQQAKRLAALVQYAQEQALLTGYDYGIYSDAERYQFVRMEKQRWIKLDDRIFKEKVFEQPYFLELSLEDAELEEQGYGSGSLGFEEGDLFEKDFITEEVKQSIVPQVLLLSSGEVTPFKLIFAYEDSQNRWQVSSDDLGQLTIERDDEDE